MFSYDVAPRCQRYAKRSPVVPVADPIRVCPLAERSVTFGIPTIPDTGTNSCPPAAVQMNGLLFPPMSDHDPPTNIPLLEGTSTVHDVRLAYGAQNATVENSYTAITYRTAAGGFIVDPPDPTPRVLRFAILYVPGDTKFIPDNLRGKSGK